MPEEIEQLKKENADLKKRLEKIEQYTTSLGGSLEFRNLVKEYAKTSLSVSTKGADEEDQAVNEAGSGTYNVLKEPVGFLEVEIDGTTYNLPYYS